MLVVNYNEHLGLHFIDTLAGLAVGGVAAHAPDGVGGVEDGLSGFQHGHRAFYFLFKLLFHCLGFFGLSCGQEIVQKSFF